MSLIYCKIDPFAYDQKVYVTDDNSQKEIGKCPIENLPTFIVSKCNEYSIDEVALSGLSQYADVAAKGIIEYSKTRYDKSIKVTVR